MAGNRHLNHNDGPKSVVPQEGKPMPTLKTLIGGNAALKALVQDIAAIRIADAQAKRKPRAK